MTPVYLATSNQKKVEDFQLLLESFGPSASFCFGMPPLSMPRVEETADTFEGNAKLKAQALWDVLEPSTWVLADDSGLVVDALGGRPGVLSKRYAGEHADDQQNNEKLLRELQPYFEPDQRSASFVCVLVSISPAGELKWFRGSCPGTIALSSRGNRGFGYDPLFVPNGYAQTFAQLGEDVKGKLSHRSAAFQEWLSAIRE